MTHDEPDDLLLGRLRDATAGDAALRRLRRRYDQLREDYEALLDRLGDLEGQLTEHESRPSASAGTAPGSASPSHLVSQLIAPLERLRGEYEEALSALQAITEGLSSLAAGAMKGQRSSDPRPATEEPAIAAPPRASGRPRQLQVEVKGKGFGELLDFQERISSIDGVARVSIHGIDSERASFIVELTD